MSRLEEGCALAILRDLYWNGESGLVIAGFGDDEFCPSLCCYTLDYIIGGRLRVLESLNKRTVISPGGTTASVIAFAQGEMVSLFMDGIDPDYGDFLSSFVNRSFKGGYPDTIVAILDEYLDKKKKEEVLGKVREIGKQLSEKLDQTIEAYAKFMHSDPIVQIVDHLPKEVGRHGGSTCEPDLVEEACSQTGRNSRWPHRCGCDFPRRWLCLD